MGAARGQSALTVTTAMDAMRAHPDEHLLSADISTCPEAVARNSVPIVWSVAASQTACTAGDDGPHEPAWV